MDIEVLLIEDPDLPTSTLTGSLLKARGFRVRSVPTDEEGIQICREGPPGVVVLRTHKSETGVLEICKCIREFSDVPILVLSVFGSPESVARVLDAGADDHLRRTASTIEVAARLRALVRRYRMSSK